MAETGLDNRLTHKRIGFIVASGYPAILRGYPNREIASPKKTIVPCNPSAGKLEHGQVVFRLFGPANQQVAEAVEPGMGPLHDPAAGFLTGFFGLDLLPSGTDVGRVAECGHYFAHLGVIVARVQA
jgi:hypothetical protein